MVLVASTFDLFICFFVFILGLLFSLCIRKVFFCSIYRAIILYVWHTIFCILYAATSLYINADATSYYSQSFDPDISFRIGTQGITYFVSFFTQSLSLSYLAVFLIFNVIGYVGLISFDASLREALKYKPKAFKFLATMIVFLPSVSFWSSAIGKDSIAFASVGLALWSALELKNRIYILLFAMLLMMFVRFHIGALMFMSLIMALLFSSGLSFKLRLLGVFCVGLLLIIIPFTMKYVGMHDGLRGLIDFLRWRSTLNMGGDSSIDITSILVPMRLFTFLFRPLPFDAHNFMAFFASIDNSLLLVFLTLCIFYRIKNYHYSFKSESLFLWSFVLMSVLILGFATANLGLAVRQKWMCMPILIYLLCLYLPDYRFASKKK